jgi:hypothetical protein
LLGQEPGQLEAAQPEINRLAKKIESIAFLNIFNSLNSHFFVVSFAGRILKLEQKYEDR